VRPILNKQTGADEFILYYWLKEELVSFCKEQGLSTGGSKEELTKRVLEYLKPGSVLPSVKIKTQKPQKNTEILSLDARIPAGCRSDEIHREFFKSVIGDHFKFNVSFMNWLKENAGKTYREAVEQWLCIMEGKKSGKKQEIGKQFEYNTYTRAFFEDNPDAKREDCIACWNYKKSLPGHNKYDEKDLEVLTLQ
jgi:hypothetical protein